MLSLARILYVIVAVAHVAVSFPVVAQSKTISPRISAGMRAKAIEVAADKQLLDYGKFLGTLSPSDKAKINCRGARIFEKRAELIWASIGEIAGASRALGEARKRLATNVDVFCKGGADPKLQNVATPMQLALQAANATLTNGNYCERCAGLDLL